MYEFCTVWICLNSKGFGGDGNGSNRHLVAVLKPDFRQLDRVAAQEGVILGPGVKVMVTIFCRF
jgi:hypothetical protein